MLDSDLGSIAYEMPDEATGDAVAAGQPVGRYRLEGLLRDEGSGVVYPSRDDVGHDVANNPLRDAWPLDI